jgi:hypothetical protein
MAVNALPVARLQVAGPTLSRLTERASFLASQNLWPAPGAICFVRRAAQIIIQASFAAEPLPSKSVPHEAKAAIAHVASALANSL